MHTMMRAGRSQVRRSTHESAPTTPQKGTNIDADSVFGPAQRVLLVFLALALLQSPIQCRLNFPYAGFETCFGWDSQIQILLAHHFEKGGAML